MIIFIKTTYNIIIRQILIFIRLIVPFIPWLILWLFNHKKFEDRIFNISFSTSKESIGPICVFLWSLFAYLIAIHYFWPRIKSSKSDIIGLPLAFIMFLVTFAIINGFYFFYFDLLKYSSNNDPINFWNSIYFTMIIFTTVGYGDIVPKDTFGAKIGVLLSILLGIMHLTIFVALFMKKIKYKDS